MTGQSHNRRYRQWHLAIFLLMLMQMQNVLATTILSTSIDTLAADAELIFEGEVIARESRLDASTGLIFTWVTFSVADIIKGDYSAATLELRFTGGNIGDDVVEISGLTLPAEGEQGIYFVESLSRNLLNPLLGWSQGHFLIFEEDGERRVSTNDQRPVTAVQPVSDIPTLLRQPQRLIEGKSDAASGIVTGTSALRSNQALSVDEFKSRLRDLIEP